MNKLYTLIFALSATCLHAHLSEIDALMKQAYHDAVKANLFKTQSFKQKDRHKRTLSCNDKACTVTVEFDYGSAPAVIKNVAEQTIKQEDKKAEESAPFYQIRSPHAPEIHVPLVFDDENTLAQCVVHWKRNNEKESTIVCSLTAALSEFIKSK